MSPIKLSWYQHQPLPNFGDDLSRCLVTHITGLPVTHAEHHNAELFAVGSILGYWTGRKRAYKKTALDFIRGNKCLAIWGTGVIRPKTLSLPRCEVLALRGPLSQQCAGISVTCTLADPGILAKELVPAAPKLGCIGIVPHYVDKYHPAIMSLKDEAHIKIIDAERPCQDVCADISSCDLILSSSLHGLVVADSYGIPNARLVLSDQIIGGDFKFRDYALGIGRREIVSHPIKDSSGIMKAADQLASNPQQADPMTIESRSAQLKMVLQEWASRRAF